MLRLLFLLSLAVMTSMGVGSSIPALADHGSQQCNIRPQADYYNCRAIAVKRCFSSGKVSTAFCEKRKAICERCIAGLFSCAKKIGHTTFIKRTCISCRAQYDRCTRNLPKYPDD